MTDRNQGGALRTFSPEQADKLFHSPALRHLFQENASDEYALIWLLSKHTKDTGSEKIYLKDIVRELNLPMPKVSAIARSLQNKGLVRLSLIHISADHGPVPPGPPPPGGAAGAQ